MDFKTLSVSLKAASSVAITFLKPYCSGTKEYLKHRINELAMNSKNKNIRELYRGMNEFNREIIYSNLRFSQYFK
jgi:hypothetical protein